MGFGSKGFCAHFGKMSMGKLWSLAKRFAVSSAMKCFHAMALSFYFLLGFDSRVAVFVLPRIYDCPVIK